MTVTVTMISDDDDGDDDDGDDDDGAGLGYCIDQTKFSFCRWLFTGLVYTRTIIHLSVGE